MQKGTVLLYMPFFLAEAMKADTSSLPEQLSPIEIMLSKEIPASFSTGQKQEIGNKSATERAHRLFQYNAKIFPYNGNEFSFVVERIVKTPKVDVREFENPSINLFKGFLYELAEPSFGKGYLIKPNVSISTDAIRIPGCSIYYITDKK